MGTTTLAPRGELQTATFPSVVRDLWKTRASGILHVSQGATAKRLMFKNGDIVFAGTNRKDERLGERLLRAGMIKPSVLDLACRVMVRSGQRLGETIVELGFVSPWEMQWWVAEQIKSIIFSVFSWDSGDYHFEPTEEPVEPDLILELKTAEVIWEGARRISDIEAVHKGIGDTSSVLRLADGDRLGIPVGQEEGFILSKVDGRATISDVLGASPLEKEDTLRRLYALLLADVVERTREEPTPVKQPVLEEAEDSGEDENRFRDAVLARWAAMKFGNFYDRLGVDVHASAESIDEAYRSVMKSLEPESHYADRLEDLKRRLDKVRLQVEEAYRALSDPKRRRAYDASQGCSSPDSTLTPMSEEQPAPEESSRTMSGSGDSSSSMASAVIRGDQEATFHYGGAQRHARAGRYFDAIASASEAVQLDAATAKYQRLLAQLLAENPSCAEASREHFKKAIAIDPSDTEAYLGLAILLERSGMPGKARGVYKKLLDVDPDNAAARAKLTGSPSP